jgi:hypothetical protein
MFQIDFDNTVCDGDSITCTTADGFHCRARAHYDQDTVAPDDLPVAALEAWNKDEWHYYGVAVTVSRHGVQLTGDYDHALWGIDGNFPNGEANRNWYLREVANELLPDAIEAAKKKIQELCK